MAQSRLERIGTIYSRVSSLIKGGAMKPEDKPLWLDIYKAFPPRQEPRFDRAAPQIEIQEIFYAEDVIRAKFQKEHSKFQMNLLAHDSPSQSQKFIAIYEELMKNEENKDSDVYEKALEKWAEQVVDTKIERAVQKQQKDAAVEKSDDPEPVKKPHVVVSDIFKE